MRWFNTVPLLSGRMNRRYRVDTALSTMVAVDFQFSDATIGP